MITDLNEEARESVRQQNIQAQRSVEMRDMVCMNEPPDVCGLDAIFEAAKMLKYDKPLPEIAIEDQVLDTGVGA